MGERVEILGGRLNLRTAPGAGTTIYATLPRQIDTSPPELVEAQVA